MAAARRISTDSARARGRSKVRAARWAAVRKRGYPPGARREQILKDMIVKARTLDGFDAAYVPGWDCHGLPIEIQIEKQLGRGQPPEHIERAARAYVQTQIERQKADFQRLGVLADWEAPYRTMDFQNEA